MLIVLIILIVFSSSDGGRIIFSITFSNKFSKKGVCHREPSFNYIITRTGASMCQHVDAWIRRRKNCLQSSDASSCVEQLVLLITFFGVVFCFFVRFVFFPSKCFRFDFSIETSNLNWPGLEPDGSGWLGGRTGSCSSPG